LCKPTLGFKKGVSFFHGVRECRNYINIENVLLFSPFALSLYHPLCSLLTKCILLEPFKIIKTAEKKKHAYPPNECVCSGHDPSLSSIACAYEPDER
jgi:hypothetical protein